MPSHFFDTYFTSVSTSAVVYFHVILFVLTLLGQGRGISGQAIFFTLSRCTGLQVEVLYYACMSHMKGQMRAKRADLLQSLRDMPDHHLSVCLTALACFISWFCTTRRMLQLGSDFFCGTCFLSRCVSWAMLGLFLWSTWVVCSPTHCEGRSCHGSWAAPSLVSSSADMRRMTHIRQAISRIWCAQILTEVCIKHHCRR